MRDSAPSPMLGFAVGIVGHRTHRIEDAAEVRARLLEVIQAVDGALDRATQSGFYPAGREPLRLISALAEGADRLAASAALECGLQLDVVLPFEPAEYREDFADAESCAEFDALLASASESIVLDGREDQRELAYEAAGMALLDNCDLIMAVWDGGPGRGRGGTREVVEEAARRGMPIVVVTPDGSKAAIRSAGPGAGPMRLEDVPELALSSLAGLAETLVRMKNGDEQMAEWLAISKSPPNPTVHSAYPLLLKLVGVGPKRRKHPAPSMAPPEIESEEALKPLKEAFDWWDRAAIQAAQAFRSAVIVNFALAALAVLLAALSLLAGGLKPLFVLAEVITIFLLLANTMAAERNRWQERWLESREVAELLRVCSMLRSVGIGRGIADPGEGGSAGWYAGAFARATPPDTLDLSKPGGAAGPLLAEVRDQAGWNESTARRLRLAAHRIERFGEVLFVIVLVAAVGWLALYVFAHDLAEALKYLLTAISAGLPAVATASYGIRVILDFEGNASRAQRIATGLNVLIEEWETQPQTAAALQSFARRAADIMLGDIAAWRLLAENRRLAIPG